MIETHTPPPSSPHEMIETHTPPHRVWISTMKQVQSFCIDNKPHTRVPNNIMISVVVTMRRRENCIFQQSNTSNLKCKIKFKYDIIQDIIYSGCQAPVKY